jgi:hypothetical protein
MKFLKSKDIQRFFLDRHIQGAVGFVIVLLLASWLYITTSFYDIPDRIILHFTSENTVDVVVARAGLYSIVAVWSLLLGINMIVLYKLYTRNKTGAYILLYSTVVMAILLFVYVLYITSVNV